MTAVVGHSIFLGHPNFRDYNNLMRCSKDPNPFVRRLFLCAGLFLLSVNLQATVTIWTSSENVARALKSLTPQFEKDFAEKVSVTVLNKDLTTQFKTAAIAGKGPDILCWANDVIGELASSGLIEPINMSKNFSDKFYSSALTSFSYGGRLYGYPYDVEALALIRNTALRPKPFTSFEELLSWSEKSLKNKTNESFYPFLFDLKNFYFNFMFFSADGGYIFREENGALNPLDIGLASKGAQNGVSFLKELVTKDVVPTSSNRNISFEKMLKGQLAATIDGPWAIKDLKKAKVPFAIDPLPTLFGKTPRPLVGTHGFIIRRSSPNKDLAKELIERYFVTAEGMATLYLEDPRGPARPDTLAILEKTLSGTDLENLRAFSRNASMGLPMPNISAMGPVWNAMGTALELIFQKEQPIETTLKNAHNQLLTAIRKSQ